ncbi:hypothetical protein ACFFQF_20320 [Haladaptatus pallidirubidus]|uniref:HVO-B0008-like N-terminal domain-containing protein n=1 Tax=Haladaptatus pallidirubidus TaxID=1008152 RepID=A0AAV3UGC7_9EURY|nr:hypothetical protein [Haladaptatus pallidirubidus]
MSENSEPAFVINCPECDMDGEFEDVSAASLFYSKHREHTSHEPEWERADLAVNLAERTQWSVFCDECAETWEFSSESEVEVFMAEHATYTDHEATEIVTDEKTTVATDDLIELIREFDNVTPDGIPEALIYAVTGDLGLSKRQINAKVDELKQNGEVYEPSTGHLRAT